VREAFKKKGHDAWSIDYLPTEIEGNHIQGDVRDHLSDGWDLMIAHPPCTHIAVSGNRWWSGTPEREQSLEFIRELLFCEIPRIALENPVSVISSRIRKPDQIIQPWQFGHDASKKTCLWLKSLPKLVPTKIIIKDRYANQTPSGQNNLGPSEDRWKLRSRTYTGIAEAMADQWDACISRS